MVLIEVVDGEKTQYINLDTSEGFTYATYDVDDTAAIVFHFSSGNYACEIKSEKLPILKQRVNALLARATEARSMRTAIDLFRLDVTDLK